MRSMTLKNGVQQIRSTTTRGTKGINDIRALGHKGIKTLGHKGINKNLKKTRPNGDRA